MSDKSASTKTEAKVQAKPTAATAAAAVQPAVMPPGAEVAQRVGNRGMQALLLRQDGGPRNGNNAPAGADALRGAMGASFGLSFSDVRLRTDEQAADIATRAGARAYTHGNEIGFAPGAYTPGTNAGRMTIAHEFAHIAQRRGGNVGTALPTLPSSDLAEWQAQRAASAVVAGGRPRVSAYAGQAVLFDKPTGASDGPWLSTGNDEELLATVLKMLDTLPDGEQRHGAITFLVGLAMQAGPANAKATERLVKALQGVPTKNFGDHLYAVGDLREWTGVKGGVRAYEFLLLGRKWFADHSKNEIGSGLVVGAFQKWLHYAKGKFAIEFLRKHATGDDKVKANLAARIVADLLEMEGTPEAKKYQANYAALRAMARANGWETFGALGGASATPRIFSALGGMRQQADKLARMVRLGPIGDQWEDADVARLEGIVAGFGQQGDLTGTSPTGEKTRIFTAENREETEHGLLTENPAVSGEWLQEMARAFTIAVDAGARIQARTEVLHANAEALDQFLGKEASHSSDERMALFDLRHEYIEAWLSVVSTTFGAKSGGLAAGYQARLDLVEDKFENFDKAVAVRKFKSARDRYKEYHSLWNQGNLAYPGNDKLDEKFFFSMREVLARERENLSSRFSTGFQTNMGGTIVRMAPSDDYIPTDLNVVAALDRDTSLFGLQSAVFLVYATNLSVHNMMLKADVGSSGFRAEQGKRMSDMRAEMEGFWLKNDFEKFLTKTDAYEATLKNVIEKIKDRAKLDLLLHLVVTLVAALVTWGAALAIRLASLSRMLALARTARAIATVSTLVEIGVFSATELTMQKAIFGKDITAGAALKSVGTNLAFLGALKLVGKFAEPLGKGGGALRKLVLGHAAAFTGVAGVSATMTRIETGQWPSDMGMFLLQTAGTYLLLVGVHKAFDEFAAKPLVTSAAKARIADLTVMNEAVMYTLRTRASEGTLTKAQFEALRDARVLVAEEVRAIGKILKDANVISAAELKMLDEVADLLITNAKSWTFPTSTSGTGEAVVKALPAPDSVIDLTRVGDTETYAYDPAKPSTNVDAMLERYKEKGFKVEGNSALMRIVDPMGRTRFMLTGAPVAAPRLLLPAGSMAKPKTLGPLERATGLAEPQLATARGTLAKINAEAEAKLPAEYPDHTVLATLAMLVEQASLVAPGWPIDAVRGLADALTLDRGIPNSAVRRLFMAVNAKKLPELFAAFHDIVKSPNVSPGSRYLIADDLRPKNSVTLIDAWREMQKKGLELPVDMDLRAVRGVARQIDKMPGGWLQWLKGIPKDKRAEKLRAVSGLTDPRVRLPENVTELLDAISADIPGRPGVNPLAGANGEAFVKLLETQTTPGKFADAGLRMTFVNKVDMLRMDVAMLQQGRPLVHGEWENIVGRANEVRQIASVLLTGATIQVSDREVGPKGQLPNVDLANFALPGGGKVVNAPTGMNVHMDLFFKEAGGTLVAMEMTTAELTLPSPWSSLDPKDPGHGSNIDWLAVDKGNASHRKFMQIVKIYQLNKMATALGTAWSGQPVDPAAMRIRAGDFSAAAARAIESMGFQLERLDGTRETAAQVEARKKPAKKTP
ncbi:MAG TPA: DUF4157 domain-containing protein [Lysobacter sp.]